MEINGLAPDPDHFASAFGAILSGVEKSSTFFFVTRVRPQLWDATSSEKSWKSGSLERHAILRRSCHSFYLPVKFTFNYNTLNASGLF